MKVLTTKELVVVMCLVGGMTMLACGSDEGSDLLITVDTLPEDTGSAKPEPG